MQRDEQLLEEYKMLKEEILYYMNKDTTLMTCLFSGVTATLFFSFEKNVPEGCILAYLIIVPICSKLAYHQKQMAKISAYISTFLEDELQINWENIVSKLSENKERPKQGKFLKFSECNMMAIATWFTYLLLVYRNSMWETKGFVFIIETVAMVTLFVLLLKMSVDIYKIKDYRKEYKKSFKDIKLQEGKKWIVM